MANTFIPECTIKCELSDDETVVIYTAKGNLKSDVIAKELKANIKNYPSKNAIWDFLNASISNLDSEALDEIINVSQLSEVTEERQQIYVVINDKISAKILNLYVAKIKNKNIQKDFHIASTVDNALTLLRNQKKK